MTWYLTPMIDFWDGRGIRSIGTADTAMELCEFAGTVEAAIRGGDNPIGHLHHLVLSPRQHRDALTVGAVEQNWVDTASRHRIAHAQWVAAGEPDQSISDRPTPDWRDPRPWQRRNAGGAQLLARTGKANQARQDHQLTLV